jgi:subtilase family serine protease
MRFKARGITVTVAAAMLGAATLAVPSGAGASAGRASLPGSRPAWATSSRMVRTTVSGAIAVRVYLAPRGGEAALAAAALAVSTPGNASYRHFITPAQYRARYGPTAGQIGAVKAWLEGAGMRATGMGPGNRYVAATGTTSAAEDAFGVHFDTYRLNGKMVRAPVADASVPHSVAGSVLGVTGLDTAPRIVKPRFPPPDGFRNARPCSAYYGQLQAKYQADYTTRLPKFDGRYRDYAVCGNTPPQLRGAYGVDGSGLTGRGATVAITDAYAAPTILADANRYATSNGDAAFASGQFTQSIPSKGFRDAAACDASGWYGEETLDVEAVHAMAPDANVVYYAGRSCNDNDFLEMLSRVIDDNTASIVTNSWDGYENDETSGDIAAYEQIFQQGSLQGIGFFFSSGDDGDELASTGAVQVDYPASDPWVTAVGGTSLAVGHGNKMQWQSGWGTNKYDLSGDGHAWLPAAADPFWYGSGGGFSNAFGRPDYQNGVVPAGTPQRRAVPDVAMVGDPTTGMLIGETQTFPDGAYYDTYRIGGTSLSSPLMAGVQADATQAAGGRLGFANPAIYALARTNAAAFTDVTSKHHGDGNVRPDFVNSVDDSDGIVYSVRTLDQDSSLFTARGWDDVTGIGSPNATYLTAIGKA